VHRKKLTAAYISRDDPRTLVERVPVLQAFRHLGPDVIDHDLGLVAPSVFEYLDVRYVVLDGYKMPAGSQEREATTRLVSEIFGSEDPVYTDERLTVYGTDLAAVHQPFLVLGDGWRERSVSEGEPWRAIASESTLVVHAPRKMSIRLHFQARAQESSELTLWLGDAVVGGFTVTGQPRHCESGRFVVEEGDSVLRLQSTAEGDRMLLSGLDIEFD
jgi:hypothetical protein